MQLGAVDRLGHKCPIARNVFNHTNNHDLIVFLPRYITQGVAFDQNRRVGLPSLRGEQVGIVLLDGDIGGIIGQAIKGCGGTGFVVGVAGKSGHEFAGEGCITGLGWDGTAKRSDIAGSARATTTGDDGGDQGETGEEGTALHVCSFNRLIKTTNGGLLLGLGADGSDLPRAIVERQGHVDGLATIGIIEFGGNLGTLVVVEQFAVDNRDGGVGSIDTNN